VLAFLRYIKKSRILLILCFALSIFNPFVNKIHAQSTTITTLDSVLNLGIKFMVANQNKETVASHYFEGEWHATMGLRTRFLLLGKKNNYLDANCFTVASIHNLLAQIYLQKPQNRQIPPMLDKAFARILSYQNSNGFNFWNALPPTIPLQKGADVHLQGLQRRPNNYVLRGRFMNNAANIANDADDTGLAYSAIALQKKIKLIDNPLDTSTINVDALVSIFEQYKDTLRKNRHWYNYLNGNEHNTGAYLTWLAPEYQFKHWNPFIGLLHNRYFYMPWSSNFPQPYKPYIPYGANDLDAVVNANVLTTLSLLQKTDAQGVKSAVVFLEKKCKKKNYNRVGIYYPNNYAFPYAVSKTYATGISGLNTGADYVVKNLLRTQKANGSWHSRRMVNHRDIIQSTAYATNALLQFGDIPNRKTQAAIEMGLKYLLQNAIMDAQGLHWKGGVFFSGGTVVRNTLFWKSDAYTTALVLHAISTYRNYLIAN
jgi:hypothetical protein